MINHKIFKSFLRNIKLSLQSTQNLGELKPLQNLNKANFDNTIREGVVFIDFWAQWCVPCVQMKPYLQSAYHDNADIVKMYEVDVAVDKNKALLSKYKIEGIPAVVAFVNGKEVSRIVGAVSNKKRIQSFVKAVLKNSKLATNQ